MRIDELSDYFDVDEDAKVYICQGPPNCDGKAVACERCYVISAHDPRATAQILDDMKRRH